MNARMTTLVIVSLVSLAIGAAGGILGFTFFVGGDGEASREVTSPTLDINALPTLSATQQFLSLTRISDLSNEVGDLQATIDALEAGVDADADADEEAAADDTEAADDPVETPDPTEETDSDEGE